MRGAQLPTHLLDTNQLRNMKIGDVAYTTPWAMAVDEDMCCFLNGRYSAYKQPGGTVTLRVERREDGYHIFAPRGEKWSPTSGIPWVGAAGHDTIPVKEVH